MFNRKSIWVLGLALGLINTAFAVDKALIIGVGKYQIKPLEGIDLDVNMAKDMAKYLGIPAQNTHLLQDEQATLANVRTQMRWLAQNVGAKDRVFFYFSGHGAQLPDDNHDESDGRDEVMVLYDFKQGSKDGLYIDDEFGTALKQIPSQNVVVVVDACHSGTGTKSLRTIDGQSGQLKFLNIANLPVQSARAGGMSDKSGVTENYLAIAAAQDNEESVATDRGSVFTLAFRAAFDKAWRKRSFSLREVFQATATRLQGAQFQPNLSGNLSIADTSINVNNDTNQSAAAPVAPPVAPSAPPAAPRNGAMWTKIAEFAAKLPPLEINAPHTLLNGEKAEFTVNLPTAGYLNNVVMVGPTDNTTVLFPNRFTPQNHLPAGKFTFPNAQMGFKITGQPPFGKTMVVAFLSQKPLNLQETGRSNRDSTGKFIATFAQINPSSLQALHKATRDLGVSPDALAFLAGKREIEIKAK